MHQYINYLRNAGRDIEKNLAKYLQVLSELARNHNGKAYLFGSYSKGESIGASDIDVLIEVPDTVDRLQVLHEARRLVPNRRIELHVLNISDAKIFKKMVKEYRVLD
ncbi:MAG: nucleotidyltransferase domain-containing protein [Candidatus Nezhaarchaeota archaeon]|nr:nucleotidyltransferase domain-containing protein [Candidatus Nezhaarchaeota archaeon]